MLIKTSSCPFHKCWQHIGLIREVYLLKCQEPPPAAFAS